MRIDEPDYDALINGFSAGKKLLSTEEVEAEVILSILNNALFYVLTVSLCHALALHSMSTAVRHFKPVGFTLLSSISVERPLHQRQCCQLHLASLVIPVTAGCGG